VLVGDHVEFKCNKSLLDDQGRYIIIHCILQGQSFVLVNIYMPNTENEQVEFLKVISQELSKLDDSEPFYTIIGGISIAHYPFWTLMGVIIDRNLVLLPQLKI
jgi:exonuclease III